MRDCYGGVELQKRKPWLIDRCLVPSCEGSCVKYMRGDLHT